jgi:hypothetical protein
MEGRRYGDEFYQFSHILHKHSAAGDEMFRQILPVLTRKALDLLFSPRGWMRRSH